VYASNYRTYGWRQPGTTALTAHFARHAKSRKNEFRPPLNRLSLATKPSSIGTQAIANVVAPDELASGDCRMTACDSWDNGFLPSRGVRCKYSL